MGDTSALRKWHILKHSKNLLGKTADGWHFAFDEQRKEIIRCVRFLRALEGGDEEYPDEPEYVTITTVKWLMWYFQITEDEIGDKPE